jgi:hypothetical protein
MLPINRAIEYANALGLVPGPSGSTQMIHIGASFYYQPAADVYVRKEDNEFVIYSPDGLPKQRVKKLGDARNWCVSHDEHIGVKIPEQDITRPGQLFCYSEHGNNPHEIVLTLSTEDIKKYADTKNDELDEGEYGQWITVHDNVTDKDYEIRSAPCGLGCRCAAQAREVTS